MTGFAKSSRNAPGLYLLVDVGAMTLDACMFRLNQHASQANRYAFMAADVRPLGVDAFHWFLAEGKTESGFIEQCRRTLNSVVWETKRSRDPHAETWKPGNDVPVFLAGGGAANRLHQEVVESVGTWLKRDVRNDGIRRLELPVPKTTDLPEAPCRLWSDGRCVGLELPADRYRSDRCHERHRRHKSPGGRRFRRSVRLEGSRLIPRQQGKGLGSDLAVDALGHARGVADEIGLKLVKLDVIEDGGNDVFERRMAFYRRLGFQSFQDRSERMFITIDTIRNMFAEA